MTNTVTLSLPLSATALRLGATLLTDLAAQSDTIYAELTGINTVYSSSDAEIASPARAVGKLAELAMPFNADAPQPGVEGIYAAGATTLAQDVATAEAATVITQETLPPVEYETVVIGYKQGPTQFAEGHTEKTYTYAGWTRAALIEHGYIEEVTEQRPKPVAVGASAASAPAPAAPAPVAPVTTSAVEVDKAGLPWDARIHSNAEVKKAATGFWKRRKNLTDEYVAEIEAALRELMAVPVSGATAPVTATTAIVAPTPPAPPAPSATAAAPAAPAPAAPGAEPTTFAELMKWVTGHIQSRLLEQAHVQTALREIGLKSLPELNTRPDLIPMFVAKVKTDYL